MTEKTETLEAMTMNMELSQVKVPVYCSACPHEIKPREKCITIHCRQNKVRLCSECCKKIMALTFQNKVET